MYIRILDELYENATSALNKFDEQSLKEAISLILQSKKIFILGIGHSGILGKILSMRLNQIGLRAYTVFDEINPPFGNDDLLIAISQSGGTKTINAIVEEAKHFGGKVLCITSNNRSILAGLSDFCLVIDKKAKGASFPILAAIGEKEHQNLSGTLFGFNIYVLFCTMVIMIAQERGETAESIDARHANLQ